MQTITRAARKATRIVSSGSSNLARLKKEAHRAERAKVRSAIRQGRVEGLGDCPRVRPVCGRDIC